MQATVAQVPEEARAFYWSSFLAATPREAVRHNRALAAVGVRYFITATWEQDAETLRLLAEQVMPEVVAG